MSTPWPHWPPSIPPSGGWMEVLSVTAQAGGRCLPLSGIKTNGCSTGRTSVLLPE